MRILFVDDEIQILKGLRRMLATVENEWETEFSTSGAEALEILRVEQFDVVVTDMRMPGMDGPELLATVSALFPDMVRIVLSGQANQESVLRAVSLMHQYLSKPCDTDKLRTTISRACELRGVLHSQHLQKLVNCVTTVPSVPSLYKNVVDEIESPDGSVQRIGELIAQDPGMTAKVLQITNSAIFAARSPIVSPLQAASLLGMEAIKSLVLCFGAFKQFDDITISGFSIESVFQRCVAAAGNARLIASSQGCDQDMVSIAFTAGMLQDLGILVLACGMPEAYADVISQATESGRSIAEVEIEVLGASHAAVGAYLLQLWGRPRTLVEAVAFHETPAARHETEFTALTAVVAANMITTAGTTGPWCGDSERGMEFLRQLNLSERFTAWQDVCQPGKRSQSNEQQKFIRR